MDERRVKFAEEDARAGPAGAGAGPAVVEEEEVSGCFSLDGEPAHHTPPGEEKDAANHWDAQTSPLADTFARFWDS